jgi:sugar phosphate isomerase/epimerase
MWAIGRFERAAEFVGRIKDLGFERVELNHALSRDIVEEFRSLRFEGQLDISSVHAPCPRWEITDGPPPEISALDNAVRATAVGVIKRTIDLAVEVAAEAVIVHSGRVEMNFNLEAGLRRLYNDGKLYSHEYEVTKDAFISARSAAKDNYVSATLKSLTEIATYAAERGMRIGLENRYHYYEIPLPDELRTFLQELDSSTIFYWHDFGHAHTLAALGLVSTDSWLPEFHNSLLGMHIHDAVGLQDHRAAGLGDVDFASAKPWVPANAVRVCEFDQRISEEDVSSGLNHLKRLAYF